MPVELTRFVSEIRESHGHVGVATDYVADTQVGRSRSFDVNRRDSSQET